MNPPPSPSTAKPPASKSSRTRQPSIETVDSNLDSDAPHSPMFNTTVNESPPSSPGLEATARQHSRGKSVKITETNDKPKASGSAPGSAPKQPRRDSFATNLSRRFELRHADSYRGNGRTLVQYPRNQFPYQAEPRKKEEETIKPPRQPRAPYPQRDEKNTRPQEQPGRQRRHASQPGANRQPYNPDPHVNATSQNNASIGGMNTGFPPTNNPHPYTNGWQYGGYQAPPYNNPYFGGAPVSQEDSPPKPQVPEPAKPPQPDPEKIQLEAELEALKAQQAREIDDKRRRELQASIQENTERAYMKRMDDLKKAEEETSRQISKVRAEAELAAREKLDAERTAEEHRKRERAEITELVQERLNLSFEKKLREVEERHRQEFEDYKKEEQAMRAQFEASLRTELERKAAAAEAERRSEYEEYMRTMAEQGKLAENKHPQIYEEERTAYLPVCKTSDEYTVRTQEVQQAIRLFTEESKAELTALSNSLLLRLKQERKAQDDLLIGMRSLSNQNTEVKGHLENSNPETEGLSSDEGQGDQRLEATSSGREPTPGTRCNDTDDEETTETSASHLFSAPDPPCRNSSFGSRSTSRQPRPRHRNRGYYNKQQRPIQRDTKHISVDHLAIKIVDLLWDRLRDPRERKMRTCDTAPSKRSCCRGGPEANMHSWADISCMQKIDSIFRSQMSMSPIKSHETKFESLQSSMFDDIHPTRAFPNLTPSPNIQSNMYQYNSTTMEPRDQTISSGSAYEYLFPSMGNKIRSRVLSEEMPRSNEPHPTRPPGRRDATKDGHSQ
ncbi:unnamed protein product [Clonostachys rosea]|uniref:HMG box domain-containing protein n=1 Tax=Bionectria ochroleuca TaxID=29856 RepID=A0ABY6UUR6_BIOOC|nr:unnamed protein product [Clonostachys rosea]